MEYENPGGNSNKMSINPEIRDFDSWIELAKAGNNWDEIHKQSEAVTATSYRATHTALRSLTLGVTGGIAIIITYTDTASFNWIWGLALTCLVTAAAIIVVGTGLETLRWDAYTESYKELLREDFDQARRQNCLGARLRRALQLLNYFAVVAFLCGVAFGLYGLWS